MHVESRSILTRVYLIDALARLFRPGMVLLQEIEVGGSRKAIIIFVPVPQLKSFQKIQVRLVRELEKKFSGKHVVFIAQVRLCPWSLEILSGALGADLCPACFQWISAPRLNLAPILASFRTFSSYLARSFYIAIM